MTSCLKRRLRGEKLARAGAILVGKTNVHEFAYGYRNNNRIRAGHTPGRATGSPAIEWPARQLRWPRDCAPRRSQ